jgi:thioredoxin-related protein
MRNLLVILIISYWAVSSIAQTGGRATTSLVPRAKSTTTISPASSQSRSTTNPAANTNTGLLRKTIAPSHTNLSNENTSNRNNAAESSPSTYTPRPANGRPATTLPNTKTTKAANNIGKNAPVLAAKPVGKVNWMSIESAVEKNKTEKRKIFIDVYTDWCGWCKHMDSTTFIDPSVANYINEHFYPVKFNAEQSADVFFKNKTYRFKKEGGRGYHELAAEWLNNRLQFPTVVFLDENQNTIQPLGGYLEATKLEAILNYFGTDSHRTTPWETYEKKFTSAKNGGK